MKAPSIRVVQESGPRAVERRLLDDVFEQVKRRTDLSRPVLIVTASSTLQIHLESAIARRSGGALLGVAVRPYFALASDIDRRRGDKTASAADLLPVFVGRALDEESELRDELSRVGDPAELILPAVSDLLSAGSHAVGDEVLIASLAPLTNDAIRRRASALIRIASQVQRLLDAGGFSRSADRLRRAAAHVRRDGLAALPASAVFIHGFADAPGAATEFLLSLLHHAEGRLYLDAPADPANGRVFDAGISFVRRFGMRLDVRTDGPASPSPGQSASLSVLTSPGDDAEIIETARRVRQLLDAGTVPESIGVVARSLDGVIVAIRRHFEAFGIPFSGGTVPRSFTSEGRVAAALGRILESAGESTADDACEVLSNSLRPDAVAPTARLDRRDLLLALRAAGTARLRDVARADWETILGGRDELRLPARGTSRSADADSDPDADVESMPQHRRMARSVLEGVSSRLRLVLDDLEAWPSEASFGDHLARLRNIVETHLGWTETEGFGDPRGALASLEGACRGDYGLRRAEFFSLASRRLRTGTPRPAGGRSGVQILDVAHARGITFDHLFVLSLERGIFPRIVAPDPWLDDETRSLLGTSLPHLSPSRQMRDEERYLFAQLVAAADEVRLIRRRADDDGRTVAASPFLHRLEREGIEATDLPRRVGDETGAVAGDLTVAHGVNGRSQDWADSLTSSFRDARARFPMKVAADPAREVAALVAAHAELARLRPLKHVDAEFEIASPLLGWVGSVTSKEDPRRATPAVTTLESWAECPWRSFLVRVLRLEAVPDATVALPEIDPLLLGQTVHAALEKLLAPGHSVRSIAAAGSAAGHRPEIPERPRIEELVFEVARRVARDEGRLEPGLHSVLAETTLAYVDEALERFAGEPDLRVLANEFAGEHAVAIGDGASLAVSFRADRFDRLGTGLRLIDYKTGRPFVRTKLEKTRRRDIRRAVRGGEKLQGMLYALALGASGKVGIGGYLFVKPEIDEERSIDLSSDDVELEKEFREAVRRFSDGWNSGRFFPRLVRAASPEKQNDLCSRCDVAAACRLHDSGVRRYLVEGATHIAVAGPESEESARFLDAWRQGEKPDDSNGSEGDA